MDYNAIEGLVVGVIGIAVIAYTFYRICTAKPLTPEERDDIRKNDEFP